MGRGRHIVHQVSKLPDWMSGCGRIRFGLSRLIDVVMLEGERGEFWGLTGADEGGLHTAQRLRLK